MFGSSRNALRTVLFFINGTPGSIFEPRTIPSSRASASGDISSSAVQVTDLPVIFFSIDSLYAQMQEVCAARHCIYRCRNSHNHCTPRIAKSISLQYQCVKKNIGACVSDSTGLRPAEACSRSAPACVQGHVRDCILPVRSIHVRHAPASSVYNRNPAGFSSVKDRRNGSRA